MSLPGPERYHLSMRGSVGGSVAALGVALMFGCESSPPQTATATPTDGTTNAVQAPVGETIGPASEPTIANLEAIVASGACTRLDRMPVVLAGLDDADFRLRLGAVVSEGRRSPAEALTEWLVLAHQYQEICDLRGDETSDAMSYVTESVPLAEKTVDSALTQGRCAFLLSVDQLQVWPYEVRMGREVLGRQFEDAEITRRLWLDVLGEFGEKCGEALDRSGRERLEAQKERLGRIVGLDDPSLIDLRSKMLEALETGESDKVVAYAKAVSEREKALDSRRAAEYDAKLAEIEKKVADQDAQLAQAQAGVVATTQQAADTSANVAQTAQNVETAARATKAAVGVLRTLF